MSTRRTIVEACVASPADVRAAIEAGADRLELCGPGDGGTTPSLALLEATLADSPVPVHVMIRPHTHGFVIAPEWRGIMRRDIALARRTGARGVVVGPILPDGTLDVATLEQFVYEAGDTAVVFHRAFDRLHDQDRALDQLLALGVSTVLTSGGAARAVDAADRLRQWQQRAGDALEILAGGGVRAHTVTPLLQPPGLRAVHAAAIEHDTFAALVPIVRAIDAAAPVPS
jgi:copper homeostasis protein